MRTPIRSDVDRFMNKFRIPKRNGTLLEIYYDDIKDLGYAICDTDKKRERKLEILEMYYNTIKNYPEYTHEDEVEYQKITKRLREAIERAYNEQ